MLSEISNIVQHDGEPVRRWFSCPILDLTLWQNPSSKITRFQISYDKDTQEKLINWGENSGLSHYVVDSGEDRPGKYKSTPIMKNNEDYDIADILKQFNAVNQTIDEGLTCFITNKLSIGDTGEGGAHKKA